MADKMKGVLSGLMGGKHAGEKLESDSEQSAMEEAETDDASIDAMGAYMDAMKSGDKAAALEAYRALQLAEG
ncbi:hypothetical protein K0U83_13755 [bacterium]|nr:hypothetical protein [bacterium]